MVLPANLTVPISEDTNHDASSQRNEQVTLGSLRSEVNSSVETEHERTYSLPNAKFTPAE